MARVLTICGEPGCPEPVERGYCAEHRRRSLSSTKTGRATRALRARVADRDNWTCGICGGRIDPNVKYPDPQSLALDHVEPVSVGGAHAEANVQAAHKVCNERKGGRYVA